MSIEFQYSSPNWTAAGSEPSTSFKATGFEAGYKPPAAYFNWFWTNVSNCITELQSAVLEAEVEIPSAAGTGAYSTVLNTYSSDGGVEYENESTGDYSISGGQKAKANGLAAIALGEAVTAAGPNSIALGNTAYSLGMCAASIGVSVTANGDFSLCLGYENTANAFNTVIGKRAKPPTASGLNLTTGDLFVIGNGLGGGSRSNALRVTANGAVMGTQAYTASGADYAEMFEWNDSNIENEDRRGMFVTLDGEKIKLANENDYILGVVSATPSIVGNASTDDWNKKYKTDIFGERLVDEKGMWILSPDFDAEKDDNYVSRLDRPEWSAIGMVGKLTVVDDGTCEINGYCLPSNGIAKKSEAGYRVVSRVDENHVKIIMK